MLLFGVDDKHHQKRVGNKVRGIEVDLSSDA